MRHLRWSETRREPVDRAAIVRDIMPGLPRRNARPCSTCGCPRTRHKYVTVKGERRQEHVGKCLDTRCDCTGYVAPGTEAAA